MPVCGDKFALKLETASPRHSYVEHQASRTIRRIGLEKIGNRRKLSGIQADCPQQSRDRVAKFGIIIDNQDTGICLTHSRYPALGKRILAYSGIILRTIYRDEQNLLPERIAGRLNHRLGTPTLRYWGMSETLRCMQREALPRWPAEVPEAAMLNRTLISIVDDDQPYRESMRKLIMLLGYTVEAFPSAADFLASRALPETACLVTDVNMPGMTGVELHRHLVDAGYAIPTILVTAYPDEVVRDQALKDGVVCYLSKPVDDDDLERCLRSALQPGTPIEDNS